MPENKLFITRTSSGFCTRVNNVYLASPEGTASYHDAVYLEYIDTIRVL